MSMCGSLQSLNSVSSLKDKSVCSKSSTMKEIESWAKEGQESIASDCGRHSGQLMDNVTEQRMLNSKLWDLSKERHKFIYQNAYEQKMFLEKMSKKSQVLKEMLDGVNRDGTRVSFSTEALRRGASLKGPERTGARMALLERFDPKNRRGSKLPKKDSIVTSENNSTECLSNNNHSQSEISRYKSAKSVKFDSSSSKGQVIITTPRPMPEMPQIKAQCWSQMNNAPKEPTKQCRIMKPQCSMCEEEPNCKDDSSGATNKKGRPLTTTTTTSVSYVPSLPKLKRHSSMTNPQSTANLGRYTRSQSAPERAIPNQDSRYRCLTDLLSENHDGLDKEISELVKTIDTLHVPPKTKKSRARPGKRMFEFLQQPMRYPQCQSEACF